SARQQLHYHQFQYAACSSGPCADKSRPYPRHWRYLNRNFESRFKSLAGAAHSVRSVCEQLGKRWAHGIRDCEHYLSPTITS
ncbi:hypothetical protein OQJ62_16400, partial [Microbulbifer thermotolerans]|uniref:hypothetical protein n=1 Tax=Microbulbifer thermotolerans TaxID=252514 RepID=UPI002248E500